MAKTKLLTRVSLADLKPGELGKPLPVVAKEVVRDLIPDLAAGHGYALDKVEGFTIDAAGNGFVVTDNDGVDSVSGETQFWTLGAMQSASLSPNPSFGPAVWKHIRPIRPRVGLADRE